MTERKCCIVQGGGVELPKPKHWRGRLQDACLSECTVVLSSISIITTGLPPKTYQLEKILFKASAPKQCAACTWIVNREELRGNDLSCTLQMRSIPSCYMIKSRRLACPAYGAVLRASHISSLLHSPLPGRRLSRQAHHL